MIERIPSLINILLFEETKMPGEIHTCPECKQPAELKCSACKLVWYCGKEHQKQHWKQHKNLCKPYEVLRTICTKATVYF